VCEKSTNCLDRLGTDIDIRNNQFVKRGVSASQSVHRVARCQALTCAGSELQQSSRCGVLPQRIWYLHAAPRPSNNETNEQTNKRTNKRHLSRHADAVHAVLCGVVFVRVCVRSPSVDDVIAVQVRKRRGFRPTFGLKFTTLPRQARDKTKHRENTPKRQSPCVFLHRIVR
jgi:hypothetical protein